MTDIDFNSGFRLSDWEVHPLAGELRRAGIAHHIEPKVMDVLVFLACNAGHVVERDRIVDEVWNGRFVSDDPLAKCITALRKVLDDSARSPRFIRTVHKRGYRLVAPVAPLRTVAAPGTPATAGGRQWPLSLPGMALAATIIATIAAAVLWMGSRGPDPGAVERANERAADGPAGIVIAVLPFENRSADPADAYFVDGIHDDLLTRLARVSFWHVISRQSVQQFRESAADVAAIAEELGATTIIEGGVQRDAERVRINVQVIDARTDAHLWAETYDETLTTANLFTVQSDIVERVVQQLQFKLTPEEAASVAAAPTRNLAAYTAYLEGRHLADIESIAALEQALIHYEEASTLDPGFAAAYAAAAAAHLTLGANFLGGPSVAEAIDKAEPLLNRAIELAPDAAEAQATLGLMRLMQRDVAEAERAFDRAIALQPSLAGVYRQYGRLRWQQSRHAEAIELARKAVSLDPFSATANLDLARYFDRRGQFADAMGQYVRVVNIEPENAFAYLHIAALHYLANGDVAESMVWYHEAAKRDLSSPSVQAVPAIASLELGDVESARFWVERGMALGPDTFWARWTNLLLNFYRGDESAALDDARVLLERYPQARGALQFLRNADLAAGRYDIARLRYARAHPELTEPETALVSSQNLFAAIDLALVLIELGDRERAAELLAASHATMADMQRLGTDGYWISDVRAYALEGRTALALEALTGAVAEGWRTLAWYYLQFDPSLASIRNEPEFVRLQQVVERDLEAQAIRLGRLKASGELALLPSVALRAQ